MQLRNYFHPVLLTLALLVASLNCGSVAYAQATDLHDAAAQLTKKLNDDPDVQKIIGEHIVVAPFENINGKGDAVPRILQEMFTTDFIKAKHFKVLERDQLQSSLDELHFQLSDLADPAKAKKIGKLAGAAYVLLGSISDTGNSTSINARIVSIESGESVAAEDEDIETGDAPLAASSLNPALGPAPSPYPALPVTVPPVSSNSPTPVDLNANANSTSAGKYTGKKDNFGLLGSTNFQIVWREDLGKDQIFSFAAGDVLGDGSSRLVLGKVNNQHLVLSIQKWSGNKFTQTWVSDPLFLLEGTTEYFACMLPQGKAPARIFMGQLAGFIQYAGSPAAFSIYKEHSESFLWNGSTYDVQSSDKFCPIKTDHALSGMLSGFSYDNCVLATIDSDDKANKNTYQFSIKHSFSAGSVELVADVVAADFDGDGEIEMATAQESDMKLTAKPIKVYNIDGVRKAVTPSGYGARMAVWNPFASKHPFLVARRNTADADGKPTGGFVYLIQWNGESYDEVWKSNQIGDAVIDMQVCDPKGEGKPGLLVLSKQKDDYYLTKIVLGK